MRALKSLAIAYIRVDRKFPKLVSYIEFLLSENKMAEQAAQRPVSDSHLGGTP